MLKLSVDISLKTRLVAVRDVFCTDVSGQPIGPIFKGQAV